MPKNLININQLFNQLFTNLIFNRIYSFHIHNAFEASVNNINICNV